MTDVEQHMAVVEAEDGKEFYVSIHHAQLVVY